MNSDFISKCCNTHNSHIRTLFGSIIEIGHELAKTLHNSSFHHKAKTCQCTYAAVGQASCIQFHFKIKLLLHKLCNTFFYQPALKQTHYITKTCIFVNFIIQDAHFCSSSCSQASHFQSEHFNSVRNPTTYVLHCWQKTVSKYKHVDWLVKQIYVCSLI